MEIPGLEGVDLEEILQGLNDASVGPLEASLEQPSVRRLKPSILDFIAPVIHEIASSSRPRRNAWIPAMARGLSGGYMDYRDRQQSEIDTANTAERARVAGVNTTRQAEALANRKTFDANVREQTVDGRLLTRRQIAEKKAKEKVDEAKALAKARVEGENEALVAGGGRARGTSAPRPPKTPAKFNPNSWRLWSDVDKVELDAIDEELKQLRGDYSAAPAFKPPTRDKNGNPIAEPAPVAAARTRIQQLNKRKFDATKRALLFHLDNLPAGGELHVWKQLNNLAETTGLLKDPQVDAALDAAAEKLLPKGK